MCFRSFFISDRKAFQKAKGIAELLTALYDKHIKDPVFESDYRRVYFNKKGIVSNKELFFPFMIDMFKCNKALGYKVDTLNRPSMPVFCLTNLLMRTGMNEYEQYLKCVRNEEVSYSMVDYFKSLENASNRSPELLGFVELLRYHDKGSIDVYVYLLQKYTTYVGKELAVDSELLNKVMAWLDNMRPGKSYGQIKEGKSAGEVNDGISVRSIDRGLHFIGRNGEFDRNDESRKISEDIQQFHNLEPESELTDHYSWEDILDAETDGYLEEND